MQLQLELPCTQSRTPFPYQSLQGDWSIVASSLPLWKGRKDVVINYQVEANTINKGKGKEREVQLAIKDEMWWQDLSDSELMHHSSSQPQPQDQRQCTGAIDLEKKPLPDIGKGQGSNHRLANSLPGPTLGSTSEISRPPFQRSQGSKSSRKEKSFASRVISSSISKGSNGNSSNVAIDSNNDENDARESEKHRGNVKQSKGKKSLIRGVSKIDPKGRNLTSFLWRGSGILFPITSNWQIIGLDSSNESSTKTTKVEKDGQEEVEAEKKEYRFLITYFQKTMFTPSGIDIYARTATSLSREEICEIIQQIKDFDLDPASQLPEPFSPPKSNNLKQTKPKERSEQEMSNPNQSDTSIFKSSSDFLHSDPYRDSNFNQKNGLKRRSNSVHNHDVRHKEGSGCSTIPKTTMGNIWNCFSTSQTRLNHDPSDDDDERNSLDKEQNHSQQRQGPLKKSRSLINIRRKKSNVKETEKEKESVGFEKEISRNRRNDEASIKNSDAEMGEGKINNVDGSSKIEKSMQKKQKKKEEGIQEIKNRIRELRGLGESTFLVPHSSNPQSFIELSPSTH